MIPRWLSLKFIGVRDSSLKICTSKISQYKVIFSSDHFNIVEAISTSIDVLPSQKSSCCVNTAHMSVIIN